MKKHNSHAFTKHKLARKPLITALEPRLLLDGAAVVTAVDILTDTQLQSIEDQNTNVTENVIAPTEVRAVDASLNNGKKEVVFIEDNVAEYQVLMDGIDAGVEVVLLDSSQDGLSQIALWAQNNSDYDAIHLISHGAEGQVNLGSFNLDVEATDARSSDLALLGSALNENGDLLLYGCSVASGEGQDFINALAQVTLADVAASDDLTGAASLNGDWDLEANSGEVSSDLAINEEALNSYDGLLVTHSFGDTYWSNNSGANTDDGFTLSESTGASRISSSNSFYYNNMTVKDGSDNYYYDLTWTADGVDLDSFDLDTFKIQNFGGDFTLMFSAVSGGESVSYTYTSNATGVATIDLASLSSNAFNDISAFTVRVTALNGSASAANMDLQALTISDQTTPASNTTPTLSNVPTDLAVTEDVASNLDLSAVTFADLDGDNLTVT
ncbi:MAG: DUF4347 domain-containing protein, partial [Marinomonas sp.]